MSLTMAQRKRLRECLKCLNLPRHRRIPTAVKFDAAVILGALVVLAIALWLRLPIAQDAVLLVLSAVAGISGAWAIWAVLKAVAKL